MQTKIVDVAIFGGGVVGSAIFNALVRSGYSAILLEIGNDLSLGASKANSGIVHGGFDAKPGTLKARFNVEGNAMFPQMCKRLGVPLKQCGAYVVGNDLNVIQNLYERGKVNGVTGLEILNREKLLSRIPNLQDGVTCGLFCKNSYIVSPYLLNICLAEEGVLNGGNVLFNYKAKRIKLNDASVKKITNDDVWHITNEEIRVFARNIVNASGSGYNNVAKLIGSEQYDVTFKRGEYYVLDHSEKDLVSSTIFPLPTEHGKGVLVTPTIDGNILVGPTSYESDDSTITTKIGLNSVKVKSNSIIKNVDLSKAIRVFSGVRTIVGDDFVVEKSKLKKNVINVAGICSPGLSSAPAIAKYVVELLGFKYDISVKNKKLIPYTNLNNLSESEKNKLIKQNPDYGKIICKCENISKGEIIDAINRPIRPYSTDGIKRRVRPGMGRCQGAFCLDRVISILSEQNNVQKNTICKENLGSEIIVSKVKEVQ